MPVDPRTAIALGFADHRAVLHREHLAQVEILNNFVKFYQAEAS